MDIGLCVLDEDVRKKLYMFKAPDFKLEKDLRVKVETVYGSKYATVKYCFTNVDLNRENDMNLFGALHELTGANIPLQKITHRIREVELDYGDV